ncbi:hypothetical protein BC831DRAFT_444240 [Entophlyctis helioformis]|nr:hypothetical protein BC831DRAFT_444240 [Entophlyctis helioformis]
MADVQREPLDPVAVRSKIYGISSPPKHTKRITSETYASHTTATGSKQRRQGTRSASFLPQVPPGGHHNHGHHHAAAAGAASTHHDDAHDESGDGGHAGTGGTRPHKRASSAHSALPSHNPSSGSNANLANTSGGTGMGGALVGPNANTTGLGLGGMTMSVGQFTKAIQAAQLQASAAIAQTDRLRVLLREKEIESMRIKHENVLLKQSERRHQKDVELFEAQAFDAPRIIKGLREELSHLKHKVKVYFGQIGEDSRQLRQIDDERRRLREYNLRLEKLVAEKNLADRDTLNSHLEESTKRVNDLEKQHSELLKKAEITEKNLMNDNRQLRGKIHNLERENQLIHERTQKLEDVIHEKDKAIASLSIYRYNAIHRKNDAVCKVCLKREKEETEQRRRQQIRECLPQPIPPTIVITSATSVQVSVTMPPGKTDTTEYSWLVLACSDDPAMAVEHVKSIKIAVKRDGSATEAITKVATFTGLTSGKYYYFRVVLGHLDVEGDPTRPEMVLVDALPNKPLELKTAVMFSPVAIRLIFKQPLPNGGSAITRYRVYTSPTPSFAERFFVAEMGTDELIQESDDTVALTYYDPQIAAPLYFKMAAVNTLGEGTASDASPETIVDFPPNKPSKPVVKRISSSSVQVVSHVEPNRGSAVQSFLVILSKIRSVDGTVEAPLAMSGSSAMLSSVSEANLTDRKEMVVPTMHGHPNDLVYVIDGLERGTTYKVRVQASNGGGDSALSDLSDEIDIDVLVPAPGDLNVEILSSSSIRASLPDIMHVEKPVIKGYKLAWASDGDMVAICGATPLIPPGTAEFIVDSLPEGQSYYFAVCLVGEHEEGVFSPSIFVPLAAAFALPPSPAPTPMPDDMSGSDGDLSSSGGLYRSLSKGSNLSITQRVSNMHHGMPAYHDPPVEDTPLSPRSSLLISPRRSYDVNAHDDGSGGAGHRDGGGGRRGGGRGGGGNGGMAAGGAGARPPAGPASKLRGGRSITNLHGAGSAAPGGSDLAKASKGGLVRSSTNLASQQLASGKHKVAAVAR